MRAVIRPLCASIRMIRPSAPFGATQTEPDPITKSEGSTGKRVGAPTTSFDVGSIRQTAGFGARVSTHTEPAPVATRNAGSGSRMPGLDLGLGSRRGVRDRVGGRVRQGLR
jgi:hypothetical protein